MRAIILSTPYTQTPPKQYGGMEYISYLLAKELSDRGIETWLVTSSDSPEPSEVGANYNQIKTIPCGNSEESMYVAFRDHVLEKNLLEIDSETIFIDHSHEKWMYMWKKAHPEINLMSVVHDAMPFGSPPPVKYPCMIGISKSQISQLSRAMGIHLELAYNGVDVSKYPVGDMNLKEDYMLFISRITVDKSPHEAIHVSNETGIPLIIAGNDGPMLCEQTYVHSVISKCDGQRIKYLGEVTQEKKVELMQKAKMVLLPINFPEPFGLVAIESMLCGTPVIALNQGAYSETIKEGGYVCENIQDMSEKVKRLNYLISPPVNETDKTLHKVLTQENIINNGKLFSSDVMADRYIGLMERCISNPW